MIDVVENCPRLDMILIPKVGVPQDVYALDMLVTQIETAKRRTPPPGGGADGGSAHRLRVSRGTTLTSVGRSRLEKLRP